MPEKFDIAVVGGGISGVSVAARLAPHARVVVLEAEEHIGTHATGRSAALLVETYGTPGMRRLTTLSRPFFEAPPAGFSEAPLSRGRAGIVYAEMAHLPRLREEFALAEQSATVAWLEADEVNRICPLLKPGFAAAGYIEPNALDLDANALLQGFARQVRRHGSEILTGVSLQRAEGQSGGWAVEAGEHRIECHVIVDAAGAWGDEVAERCGVERHGLQPMRRTAATIGVPPEIAEMLAWHPFVTPVDGSYYFKPDAGAIMVSLSEEAPSPLRRLRRRPRCGDSARAFSRGDDRAACAADRDMGRPAHIFTGPPAYPRLRARGTGLLLVCGAGRNRYSDIARPIRRSPQNSSSARSSTRGRRR